MSIAIRLPNITAKDESGQLLQVKSYLHQLVEQLNWALNTIALDGNASTINEKGKFDNVSIVEKDDPVSTFNSIKGLIIKSADIVDAYCDEINKKLEGLYVAESDFGTYKEQTTNEIRQTSSALTTFYANMQQILSDIEGINNQLISVKAHTNTGLLYYEDGAPIYGFEVGQRTVVDGKEVFNKFARFTADRLSFYDQNDNEVAYVSDQKLYITHVEITGSFLMGGFVDTVLSDGSIVTKWKGTGG